MKSHRPLLRPRQGAAAILILILTTILFIAVVLSIDIARIQLAQLELQSGSDLAARAGAEALSRGVGDPNNHLVTDSMIRAEIDMVAQLNKAGGDPIELDLNNSISFGTATENLDGSYQVEVTSGSFDGLSDSVNVQAQLPAFPVVFGGFVSRESVNLAGVASSMVTERDMVVVLDRSTSMLEHDAGTLPVGDYNANLRALEDALYDEDEDFYYPGGANATSTNHTEFVENNGMLTLSRTQALKLAVLKFRQEIDASRGHEQLGLTTYSPTADTPSEAYSTTQDVDIVAGLSSSIFDSMVGDGEADNTERYASALETDEFGYRNFDYNYLAMRRWGGTNIVDGLEKGCQNLFGTGHRQFATPVLILMTDGNHNGAGDPVATATSLMAAHPNLRIYTVSFGSGADQTTMASVAAIGKGTHHHVTDVYQLVAVFKKLANSAGVVLIE
jgi:Ca-activated chloride channel family protein